MRRAEFGGHNRENAWMAAQTAVYVGVCDQKQERSNLHKVPLGSGTFIAIGDSPEKIPQVPHEAGKIRVINPVFS